MSSTNKTSNLELSQFIGTDSPKWLTDYNSDMQNIDAGVARVQTQADATDLVVAGHTSSIQNNTQSIIDQQTAITSLRADVTAAQGSINTINSLIGNGEPTTTDKTIIGAINELAAEIEPSGGVSAASVSYSNTSSGLTATNVQAAIDEVDAKVDAIPASTVEKKTATLAAGSTSVTLTFKSQTIKATTFVDWFTSDPEVAPTSITTSATTVVLTFEAQASALTVGVRVEN